MARIALCELLPCVAVMVALVDDVTTCVVTMKVAVDDPAGTVTVEGTAAFVLLDDRLTTIPPVPAALERVTVPVEVKPPRSSLGESESEIKVGGLIAKEAVRVVVPTVAAN